MSRSIRDIQTQPAHLHGDQFYRPSGFGVQRPLDVAALGYLRKWIMRWEYATSAQDPRRPPRRPRRLTLIWGAGGLTPAGRAGLQREGVAFRCRSRTRQPHSPTVNMVSGRKPPSTGPWPRPVQRHQRVFRGTRLGRRQLRIIEDQNGVAACGAAARRKSSTVGRAIRLGLVKNGDVRAPTTRTRQMFLERWANDRTRRSG
jgi:hypothetical protein